MSRSRKNGKAEAGGRTGRRLTLTRRAPLYLILWLGALIFTQALRSTASNIFFTFVIFLPVASLVYLLVAGSSLRIHMLSEHGRVEKLTPYNYNFRVINESVVPFPFTEVILSLPRSDAVRCSDRCVRISLSPHGSYTVKNTVKFRFRGTYEIGVRCFYVYDLMRIFRRRIDIDTFESVEVLPRRLGIGDDDNRTASDSANRTVKLPNSYDRLEVSDVREYRLGDTLKSIHWNLSSKSEDLVVRDYNTGTTDLTCIFCDMSAHFPDEPPRVPETDDDSDGDAADTVSGEGSKKKKKSAKNENTAKAAKTARIAAKRPKKDGAGQSAANDGAADTHPEAHRLAADAYYADMNEFCADGVVELTIAAVLRELRAGSAVRLMWFDERAVLGAFAYEFNSPEDFEAVFDLFATAPVIRGQSARRVTELAAMLRDSCESRSIYVIPAVDDATVAAFCDMRGVAKGDTTFEVMLYDPEERYSDRDAHREYIGGCRAQLAANGAELTVRRAVGQERYGDTDGA